MRIKLARNAAMTLTEIMIMLAIMALLAMIGTFHFLKAHEIAERNECIANLKLIANAKAVWAIEHNKPSAAVPTDADLFGPTGYISYKPKCPNGGVYVLGSADSDPMCWFALTKGHMLQDQEHGNGHGHGHGHASTPTKSVLANTLLATLSYP